MREEPRFLLTAGHPRAHQVVALGERLLAEGWDVAGVLMVSAWNVSRIRKWARTWGPGFLRGALRRSRGKTIAHGPMSQFMESMGVGSESVAAWARRRKLPFHVVRDLNSPASAALVQSISPDVVLYGGGGILRESFLNAAGRVVNAHAGPLPEVRGMNAVEWSVLLGFRTEVTIHFIDRGIDTGAVLLRLPLDVDEWNSVNELREAAVVQGIQGLVRVASEGLWKNAGERAETTPGRQCFVMAPVLRDLLEARLSR